MIAPSEIHHDDNGVGIGPDRWFLPGLDQTIDGEHLRLSRSDADHFHGSIFDAIPPDLDIVRCGVEVV